MRDEVPGGGTAAAADGEVRWYALAALREDAVHAARVRITRSDDAEDCVPEATLRLACRTRRVIRQAGLSVIAALLLAPLMSACGGAGDAHGSCTPNPPDVVALRDVPFGGGDEPSQAEREAEVRYEAYHPNVFAGAIFGGGHDYIGFTGDAGTHLAELRKQVPDPEQVRAYCAEHTNRELVQLQRRITADTKILAWQGINVVSINANTLTQRVEIGVSHLTPHIEQVLRDRYGDLVGTVLQTEVVMQ